MSEVFEFEYNALEEMLIVNYQEGFSYNMCDEGDVYSVAVKLNEQQTTITELKEENEQLRQILKDIVGATDETYTKNRNIYKVSVVFDNETYLKIRECLNE